MTKQNVMVEDSNLVLDMAITVVSNTLFTPAAVQKPPVVPGGYITISRKMFLPNLDVNGGAKITSWVESMRASSPTHLKSTPSLAQDISSWKFRTITGLE